MTININKQDILKFSLNNGAELTIGVEDLFNTWINKHFQPNTSIYDTDIGIPTPRSGEKYLGAITEPSGRVRHIFLLPGEVRNTWEESIKWAKNLGGDLPDRIEQSMFFTYMPEEFRNKACWSNMQHTEDSDYAWLQYFDSGNQISYLKKGHLDSRAVRREYI